MSDPSRADRPEILAPAGDPACMEAAVRAGADAVYFGLQGFNARARATNFDAGALAETMAYLHRHGARGYVTLNTLVFDSELASFEAAVRACAEAGVDAVIVQDLGVTRLVRAVAPSLPIHASTQMTCSDAGAVDFAAELGATRVILARELSLDDIAAIRAKTEVPVEVFVHGALCIAYSGQCLTSEAIGGRSANRGACAQACRLPYELVVDGEDRPTGDRAFLLSPEDLEASALVPRLMELGVSSLKIEGRLKGPAYVAATTALYRSAVDQGTAPAYELRETALQMYSRGSGPGFLAGVDHQRLVEGRGCDHRGSIVGEVVAVERSKGRTWLGVRLSMGLSRGDGILVEGGREGAGEVGGRIWAITTSGGEVERAEAGTSARVWLGPSAEVSAAVAGRRVFRTDDPHVERAVLSENQQRPRRVRVDVKVSGAIGEPCVFEAHTERGQRARAQSHTPVAEGRSGGTTVEQLREKLGRLGDTPFVLGDVTSAIGDRGFVPPAAINRARRDLVDSLGARGARWETTPVTAGRLLDAAAPPDRAAAAGGLFVLCRSLAQAHAALDAKADGVVLDLLELTGTGAALRALRARGAAHVTVAPPRIRKPGEEKIERYLDSLSPDAVLVRSLGALRDTSTATVPRVGDFSLNVANRLSAAEVLARGLSAFTPSLDLDASQLVALLDTPFGPWAEVVLHHPMALFHMEHCVIASELSEGRDHRDCGRPCERHQVSLRDRAGLVHPVEADVGCRNTVFHAAPQSAAAIVPAARRAGVRRWRIELVRETPEEVARVVEGYRSLLAGKIGPAELWRSLKVEGRYGVVRGSLRVIQA